MTTCARHRKCWTRTLRHDEGRVSLMCDCRSDWVTCFRRDCERAAALNEATSSRSNEHLNLLMTPVGASKGQARNWHTMPTSTTYDSRVGRLFNGFIAHRARSYTQSVCLSAGVRVPRRAGCVATAVGQSRPGRCRRTSTNRHPATCPDDRKPKQQIHLAPSRPIATIVVAVSIHSLVPA